ncbi:DNA polymerase III subunit alpha [candidate division CSSED10-310 bacterium]|uniref:DNA-directed DNA polymerase n=1 Tax=candidate division CSSED10-310 bacterium TaxID=2855610 RepID=A0ABV6YU78_UNCC1
MGFVHLHCHSCYSLLEGADWPAKLVEAAKASGMDSLAITDTNGLYGAVPFYKAAREANIKPIFGVELVAASESAERVVVLARDRQGYAELCRLITARQLEGEEFDLGAAVSRSLVEQGDHIFVLCSHEVLLSHFLRAGRKDCLYVDLAPYAEWQQSASLRRLRAIIRQHRLPLVATNDVHFRAPEGYRIHRVLSAIRHNTTVKSLLPDEVVGASAWLKKPQEMARSFSGFPVTALTNTARIAEQCQVEFEMGRSIFPKFPLPMGETAFSYLWKLCFRGAVDRYQPLTHEVIDRLTRELEVIDQQGFAEYFLIVWDIARYAREQGIPSVGRGSAANSIVSYVLQITHVDPIALDLFFERFLNPERNSCPDIDLDFCWRRRDQVLEYVYNRYGRDRVAMISTHSTLKARAAVREIAKTLGVPEKEISAFTEHFPHFASQRIEHYVKVLPELRQLPIDREPFASVIQIAKRIDGFPRHLSIHCGGIVVCPFPLTEIVPLQRSAKGFVITQYDMYPIEELGLLKIDLLGQRGLSVIADSAAFVERNYGLKLDLTDKVVQKDPPTVRAIREGRTMGCFYIESPGMRGLLRKLKVETFEELTAASSVIRPGVSESGMMKQYIDRSNGLEPVVYLHPKMEQLLGRTFGVMIYQEDVIKVAHGIAGLSFGEADLLRRAMSGKGRSREAMKDLEKQFLHQALQKKVAEKVAREIWRQIASFAGYAFCKAHSASFAQISFQSAYMKVHHPAEFMAAVLSNQGGFYHTSAYLEEARRLGLKIKLPDINKSLKEYTGIHRFIRVGLMQIRSLKETTIQKILRERKKGLFVSLEDFCRRLSFEAEETRNLIKGGAFDCFEIPRTELLWRLEVIEARRKQNLQLKKKIKPAGAKNGTLFDDQLSAHPPVIVPRMPLLPSSEKLRMERQALDLMASVHPLELFQKQLAGLSLVPARRLSENVGRTVNLVGWLVTTRRVRTKSNEYMRFVTMEDTTGTYELILFPKAYQKNGHVLTSRGPYLIHGRVEEDNGHHVVNGVEIHPLAGPGDPFQT